MIRSSAVALGLALFLCFLMPSSQSIWMDEYETWRVASLPTLSAVWSDLRAIVASEALMPVGMGVAWVAQRIFGESEWQLRAVNIVWTALAVGAFAVLGRRWRMPWAPLILAVQPFVWYYANEARPYSLQVACAAWLLVGLVAALEDDCLRPRTLGILLVSGCVLLGTTLFGILTAGPVAVVVTTLAWRQKWTLPKGWPFWLGLAALWCAALGWHYLTALLRGAGGVKLWDVGVQNVAFALYEFTGFTGYGLGRAEIREIARAGGAAAVLREMAGGAAPMALLALGYLALVTALWRDTSTTAERRTAAFLSGIAATSALALVILAMAAQFPFWGRHLAPVFPFFCALLVLGLRDLPNLLRPPLGRIAATSTLALLAASSALLRLAPHHAKDNYRAAVSLARAACSEGKAVWWAADPKTPRYYGLNLTNSPRLPGAPHVLHNVTAEALAQIPHPDLIFYSKADTYDKSGVVAEFVRGNDYRPVQKLSAIQVLAPVSGND